MSVHHVNTGMDICGLCEMCASTGRLADLWYTAAVNGQEARFVSINKACSALVLWRWGAQHVEAELEVSGVKSVWISPDGTTHNHTLTR